MARKKTVKGQIKSTKDGVRWCSQEAKGREVYVERRAKDKNKREEDSTSRQFTSVLDENVHPAPKAVLRPNSVASRSGEGGGGALTPIINASNVQKITPIAKR